MKRMKRYLLLVAFVIAFCGCTGSAALADSPDYEHTLFDTGVVHQINISLSGEDWDDLLANPVDKTKYKADIEIDGEMIRDVSLATKGNSSLFLVAADPYSSRYSFKVNFGKYVDGQTYHGLDKLNLNNNISDATLLKDYLCYEIFRQAGVPAPLASFAWLTVNGEARGLYMAIEDEDDSFLERINHGEGAIYKPESKDVGLSLDMLEELVKNGLPPSANAKGADLIYIDDDPNSYPDIFEHDITGADEEKNLAIVAAMKCLAEGKDLDTWLDTDEIIRYFAAHNFVLNYDSYTGFMLHNLALFERDGRMCVLPWDYNLSFGAFIPVIGEEALMNATDLINTGIDSPLIGTEEDSRPLWSWIVKDENYRTAYHNALDDLVTAYFESGEFEREVSRMSEMLLPYVKEDPTSFYTAEEFTKGCETLRQFGIRRAESIRKQLQGALPAINKEQSDPDKVDASDLNLKDMGVCDLDAIKLK